MYETKQNAVSECCVACSLYSTAVIGSLLNSAKGDVDVEDPDATVIPHACSV